MTTIGLDLAKRVFQLHGALADGAVASRKKLTRAQLLSFLGEQPRCIVAMEACALPLRNIEDLLDERDQDMQAPEVVLNE